jgi:hypothetical protein
MPKSKAQDDGKKGGGEYKMGSHTKEPKKTYPEQWLSDWALGEEKVYLLQ